MSAVCTHFLFHNTCLYFFPFRTILRDFLFSSRTTNVFSAHSTNPTSFQRFSFRMNIQTGLIEFYLCQKFQFFSLFTATIGEKNDYQISSKPVSIFSENKSAFTRTRKDSREFFLSLFSTEDQTEIFFHKFEEIFTRRKTRTTDLSANYRIVPIRNI